MRALDVFVRGVRAGLLERLDEFEHRFLFDEQWLADPTHPLLGQVFEDKKPNSIDTTGQMPLWFEHLLPPPTSPMRRALAREAGLDPTDGFDLLWRWGADLPGAVTLAPGQPSLRPARDAPPDLGPAVRPGELRLVGAGQQWKLSVREGDRGLVVAMEGHEASWMAKFHDPAFNELPRVEYATMHWASLSGLDIPSVSLAKTHDFPLLALSEGTPTGDGTFFLIERFDRPPGGGRTHLEDFAQVLDRPRLDEWPAEHIVAVVARLCPHSLRALCERLAFCAVCGNGDGHLKNWSLLYPDGRNAVLSPAYDIISTVVYPQLRDALALSLGGSDRFESVTTTSFEGFARVTSLTSRSTK